MKKFVLMGALAATLSLSLVPGAFAEGDSAVIDQYSKGLGADNVSQVSSVSELTDVNPNSWAFQALKSLVERYGCIEGYPNKTYLGNRPLSRYEFAAGLNACLDKIGEQIAAATANLATKDDLAALQRLQEEFKNELAVLRGRVDALEARTKELEANQFSTTTKLDGSVVMAIQGGNASGNVQVVPTTINSNGLTVPTNFNGFGLNVFGNTIPAGVFPGFEQGSNGSIGNNLGNNPTLNQIFNKPNNAANMTFFGRTTLNFRATFTGRDELLVRLRGVTGQDIGGTYSGIAGGLGTAFYAGGPAGSYDGSTNAVQFNGNSTVSFDKVRYTTPLFSDNFRVFIGPRIDLLEVIDTNSFANNEEVDFSNGSLINDQLQTFFISGPGAAFDFNGGIFSLRAAYIAGSGGSASGPNNTTGFGGLFGSNSQGNVELEFRPIDTVRVKLQYAALTTQSISALNGFPTTPTKTNAYGINAEWGFTPGIGVFGRYGFGTATTGLVGLPNGTGSCIENCTVPAPNFNLVTWSAGFAFNDLFLPGSGLGIAVGQPLRASNIANGSETDYELFYRFQVSDRISLTPDIQIITSPNNIYGNSTITVGTLRAVFNF